MYPNRQTPNKKRYKAPFKTYTIAHHNAAYTVYKNRLYFCPIYENGSIDYNRKALLLESPEQFRSGHKIALLKLGITDKKRMGKVIGLVGYY